MIWKSASQLFHGGTDAARKLTGKRVRLRTTLIDCRSIDVNKPGYKGKPITLHTGREGLVGYVPDDAPDQISSAFARSGPPPGSLDQLVRLPYDVIRGNWPTFRMQFDIEA
jgi:hypothetical protein